MSVEATDGIMEPALLDRRATDAISIRLVTARAEWDSLLAAAPVPHLPQSFAFGAGKAASGWQVTRVAFEKNGETRALVTVLQLRRMGLTLVNRINRGPIFLGTPDDELVVAVYRAVRERWGRIWTAPLSIAPALPAGEHSDALLRRAGYRLRQRLSWQSGRIDLRVGEDTLWAQVISTFRNRVRKAEKEGATLRVSEDAETFEWMIKRHSENMAEKGFSGPSPALLRALRATAPESVLVFQLVGEGGPVAGMSVVRFGTHAEYHVGWFGPEGRKLNAGNFLMWQVMCDLHRRGVETFDVGGLRSGDGYTRFKRTMCPAEYQLAGEWISF